MASSGIQARAYLPNGQRNHEYFRAYYLANKSSYEAAADRYRHSSRGKFIDQRRRATRRGVPWRLSYEDWLGWWGDDLPRRGRGADDLCMARKGDTGAYELTNIYKSTNRENRELYYASQRGVKRK